MSARNLSIQLLGAVAVTSDKKEITSKISAKGQALLAFLAVNGRPFSREYLAELLWDDRAPEQAQANFRSLLSGLRRQLGPFLDVTRQSVALALDASVWLDVREFETAVHPFLSDPGAPLTAAEASALEAALQLYTDDLMAGFFIRESRGFEAWLTPERERLRRLAVTALQRLVTDHLAHHRYAAGLRLGERLVALDPLSETAVRQLMLLHARNGRRHAALLLYRQTVERLATELDVPPAPATRALYDRLQGAGPLVPLRLPVPDNDLLGRQEEIETIVDLLLRSPVRLVTLLGPGGAGKTRLAVEMAQQFSTYHAGRYLHGVVFVSLVGITQPNHFFAALVAALQLEPDNSGSVADTLLAVLADKELLLVMDNFETARSLPGGDEVLDWLSRLYDEAPDVTTLVTSRERLYLQEERLIDIGGLPYPLNGAGTTPDHYASGLLFLQSVRRHQYRFEPDQADAMAIATICRHLEGMPLALELAAANVRDQGCREVATAVAAQLPQLRNVARNVPERHATLRAVFNHSWTRLRPEEKQATSALSVFTTPFTADAALTVARVEMPTLTDLADKSILRHQSLEGEKSVFAMHAVLRLLAAERLESEEDAQQLRTAHSRYFAKNLAELGSQLDGARHAPALAELSRVEADLRAAWHHAIAQKEWATVDLAAEPLMNFYWTRSQLPAGLEAMQTAVSALEQQRDTQLDILARLRLFKANFHMWLGDFETTATLLAQADERLAPLDDGHWSAEVAIAQTYLAFFTGDYTSALAMAERALTLYRALDDPIGLANALNARANIHCELDGDYTAAVSDYQAALALYREASNASGEAKVLLNLGSLHHAEKRLPAARSQYEAAVAICRRLGSRRTLAIGLGNLARVAAAQGDHVTAEAMAQESLALKRAIGDRRSLLFTLISVATAAREREAFAAARHALAEALDLAARLDVAVLTLTVLTAVAYEWLAEGNPPDAYRLAHRILTINPADQEILSDARALSDLAARQLSPENIAKIHQQFEPQSLPTLLNAARHKLSAL